MKSASYLSLGNNCVWPATKRASEVPLACIHWTMDGKPFWCVSDRVRVDGCRRPMEFKWSAELFWGGRRGLSGLGPNFSFKSKHYADRFKRSPGQLSQFETKPTSWGLGRRVHMWCNRINIKNLKIISANTGGEVDSLKQPSKCQRWTYHGWPSASNCIALLKNILPGHIFHPE